MRSRDIRKSFLDYFQRQGHAIVPSSSLVPSDDPTLLFTNAGMNQFKDVFLGREKRPYTRATTSQKCMRVSGKHNDLDNVGPSLRHHTFFEMLGNFSFGDYFKQRGDPVRVGAADERLEPPADRLFPTIFKGEAGIPRDDEALRDLDGASCRPARITELGLAENFWQMGETGPCGRCSEIHFHRGDARPLRRGARRRRLPRHRLQLRPLRRSLEQRVHGVRPPGRRHAESAAGAVDRHRHGPRAHHRRSSRASCRTTTPICSRRSSRRSASAPAALYRRDHGGSARTSRCASSPTTCGR